MRCRAIHVRENWAGVSLGVVIVLRTQRFVLVKGGIKIPGKNDYFLLILVS
jgi:hypothetical protein